MAKKNAASSKYPDVIVDRQRIAFLLDDIDPVTVSRLATEGLVIKAGRNGFYSDASVRTYIRNSRAMAARHSGGSTGISIMDENALTKRAHRERAEMARDEEAGKLFRKEDLDEAWAPVTRTFRNLVQSIPQRAKTRLPNLSQKDLGVLRQIVHELLIDAAIGKFMESTPIPLSSIPQDET